IPTLETGRHTLRSTSASKPIDIEVPELPTKRPKEAQFTLDKIDPNAKSVFLFTPRETLAVPPDRPANDPLRGPEADIKTMVLDKIPLGTKYYRAIQIGEHEGWKLGDLHQHQYESGSFGSKNLDYELELGSYGENGKTIKVIAILEADQTNPDNDR